MWVGFQNKYPWLQHGYHRIVTKLLLISPCGRNTFLFPAIRVNYSVLGATHAKLSLDTNPSITVVIVTSYQRIPFYETAYNVIINHRRKSTLPGYVVRNTNFVVSLYISRTTEDRWCHFWLYSENNPFGDRQLKCLAVAQ